MSNNNQTNNSASNWPVSFEADHLYEMLKLTPAQRLEWAEELLRFAILAGAVKGKGTVHL